MKIIRFDQTIARSIKQFASVGASSVALASGRGDTHVYAVYLEAGGSVGPHPAGFDQLFLVVQGSGWVSGADGVRVAVTTGQGAFLVNGELHAKGSDTGMVALMLQASAYTLREEG